MNVHLLTQTNNKREKLKFQSISLCVEFITRYNKKKSNRIRQLFNLNSETLLLYLII